MEVKYKDQVSSFEDNELESTNQPKTTLAKSSLQQINGFERGKENALPQTQTHYQSTFTT